MKKFTSTAIAALLIGILAISLFSSCGKQRVKSPLQGTWYNNTPSSADKDVCFIYVATFAANGECCFIEEKWNTPSTAYKPFPEQRNKMVGTYQVQGNELVIIYTGAYEGNADSEQPVDLEYNAEKIHFDLEESSLLLTKNYGSCWQQVRRYVKLDDNPSNL